MARTPLYNGLMQSDLDANGFRIINLGGAGNVQSGTVYVDPEAEPGTGEIDSTAPFDNLEDALAAAPAGYNIIMRPAVYRFDGQLDVSRQVTIIGYGATIAPATPGEMCGLAITASGVSIFGLSFDGELDPGDAVNAQAGVIEVSATLAYLKFIYIANYDGIGIKLIDRFSNFVLEESLITACHRGIQGDVTTTSVNSVTIRDNTITANRQGGIIFNGVNNVGDIALTTLEINSNEIAGNDTDGDNRAGINISGGTVYFQINDNFVYSHYRGIIVEHGKSGTISSNHLSDATQEHIRLVGHQEVDISGNIIDCSNPANGDPMSMGGINVLGDYATTNDSGPLIISGNQITKVDAADGLSIKLANTNDTTIVGNQLQKIEASSYLYLLIAANNFLTNTADSPINLLAAERGSHGATISANRFTVSGTPVRLIATDDTSATGHSNIHIMANSSSPTYVYSQGIVDNVGGTAPTGVYITANTPPSPTGDPRDGWVNDDPFPLQNQVIVSQSRGYNTFATRESDAHPYSTIAAAMADAVSGDTVYIRDGVFNELVEGKDGVTVIFEPSATLVCTTANGCIISGADNENFTLYHEHAAISSSKAGQKTIEIAHSGAAHRYYLGGALNTGTNTGTIADTVYVPFGSVFIHIKQSSATMGIVSSNAHAISAGQGTCHVYANHGEIGALGGASAIHVSSTGSVHVEDAKIYADGDEPITIATSTSFHTYKRCSIQSFGAGFAAVQITGNGTNNPIFRDCLLLADDTATQSIAATGAQDVVILGSVNANIGPEPPTNVTFLGGGIYNVDADATMDWY